MGGFFANLLVKYDDFTAISAGVYRVELDGHSYGATAQVGALFGDLSNWYFEPSATLAYTDVSLENFSLSQGSFVFDEGETLTGQVGTRIGKGILFGSTSARIYASGQYVTEFEGIDNILFASGGRSTGFANQAIGDFGKFGLGVALGESDDSVNFGIEGQLVTGSNVDGFGIVSSLRYNF